MSKMSQRKVLIVVENLPVPLDRRVWLEATTLVKHGYKVSVICPTGRGWDELYEEREGVHIYRFPEPREAHHGAISYAMEWGSALWHMFRLARVVRREQGFDIIHGCNPPDLVFLLALRYRLSGVRYLFDHHDVCPELFEAKFGKRGLLYQIMLLWERMTFATADVSIATNESFKKIAIARGKMAPEDVVVVRSAPQVDRFKIRQGDESFRKNAKTLVSYVGVIGQQEGMDLLVQAVEHLTQQLHHTDVHFAIIGFGPHLNAVKKDVADRGLENYFTFTGALYGDALLDVLNASDIGVAPDPKNAMNDISTMNKVIEYMALELPSVQFDLAEGRASAEEASLYAKNNDPADFARQIAYLIENPDKALAMGKTGRARVLDQLSWEHSTPKLIAAYERAYQKLGESDRSELKRHGHES